MIIHKKNINEIEFKNNNIKKSKLNLGRIILQNNSNTIIIILNDKYNKYKLKVF